MDREHFNNWAVYASIVIFILFCTSAFQSCQELTYSLGGKSCSTVVADVWEVHNKYGAVTGYKIGYDVPGVKEQGFSQIGVDELANYPVGIPIDVEYMVHGPFGFSSRLKGKSSKWWVVLFFVFLALLVGCAAWGMVHSRRSSGAEKAGSKRRR